MKTDGLLQANAMPDASMPCTGLPDGDRAQAETAIAEAYALIHGKSGMVITIIDELVRRIRHGLPVPAAYHGIAFGELFREIGIVRSNGHLTNLASAAAHILLPHLKLMYGGDTGAHKIQGFGRKVPSEIVIAKMNGSVDMLRCPEDRRTLDYLISEMAGSRTLPSFNKMIATSVIQKQLNIIGSSKKSSELVIRRWGHYFALEDTPTVVRDGAVIRLETTPSRIERYLADRENGLPLATSERRKGQACLKTIDRDTGIGYANLRNYRHLIDAAVASGRVTLGPVIARDKEQDEAVRALRRRRLEFIDRCVKSNIALPTLTTNRRAYDFEAIAALDDVDGDSLAGDIPYVAAVYRAAPLKLLPSEMSSPGETYGRFEDELRRERKVELAEKKSGASMLAQTMGAYKEFRLFTDRGSPNCVINDELSYANVERVIAAVKAAGAVRRPSDFQTNIRIIARIHATVVADDGLGEEPGQAISLALRRSEKTIRQIAEESGLSENALAAALHSKGYRTAKLLAGLPVLEKVLGYTAGRLSRTVTGAKKFQGLKVGGRQLPPRMQDFVSDDWATMNDDDYETMVAWIDDNILRQPTPFGKAMSQAVKLGRAAARIRKDLGFERKLGTHVPHEEKTPYQRSLENLVAYKMEVFASDGLLRRGGSFWVDRTARMRLAMLIDLGNFVTDPVEAGGLGLDAKTFDLPHLLNTNIPKVYVDQMAHRLADVEWGGPDGKKRGPLFTRLHADLMTLLASIFRTRFGFAYQQPEMATSICSPDPRPLPPILHLTAAKEVLKVLPGFKLRVPETMPIVPVELVGMNPAQYMEACSRSADIFSAISKDLRQLSKRSRDPIITIKGLVHSDDPVRLALEHLRRAEGRTPSIVANPMGHHLHKRNLAMAIFSLLIAFRPRNMRELTSGGEARQIWFENGAWKLEIDYQHFKNWKSTPLFADKSPFERTIPEIPGFYEIMDYYFSKSRPFLVGIKDTPNFFVDVKGNALEALSYWRLVREFTARHLAYNPYKERGIKDVMPFNPYSWRYVRATDILLHPALNSNPYREAANALQTSEAMILRYYARIRPDARNSDQDERFRVIANEVWKGER